MKPCSALRARAGNVGAISFAAAHNDTERVRAVTDLPIAVGLGVSTGDQAAEIAGYADGVIVGSAFIRLVQEAPDPQAAEQRVRALAGELAAGVRRRTGE